MGSSESKRAGRNGLWNQKQAEGSAGEVDSTRRGVRGWLTSTACRVCQSAFGRSAVAGQQPSLHVEHLEARKLLSYTASLAGTAPDLDVTFTGDSDDDSLPLGFPLELSLDASGNLQHNRFTVGDPGFVSDIDLDSTTGGEQSRYVGDLESVSIHAGDGEDTLRVDFSGGNPIPSGEIHFDGEGDFDELDLIGAGSDFATNTYTFTGPGAGEVDFDGSVISFTDLAPISNDGTPGEIIFNLPGSADDVTLEDTGTATDGLSRLIDNGGTFETTTFTNPTDSLTLNGNEGADELLLTALDSGFDASVHINGGPGNDSFTVDVDSASGSDIIDDPIHFDGGIGDDLLHVRGEPATTVDEVVYRVGPETTSGRLDYEDGSDISLMSITFAGLDSLQEATSGLTPDPDPELTVMATDAPNAINYREPDGGASDLDGDGTDEDIGLVSVDDFTALEFTNKSNLRIDGLAGSDFFYVDHGGDPDGLDDVTIAGGGRRAGEQDHLIVQAAESSDVIYTSARRNDDPAQPPGQVTIEKVLTAPSLLVARDMDSIHIEGQGQNTTMDVEIAAETRDDKQFVHFFPGLATDSGTIQILEESLADPVEHVPLTFANFGEGPTVDLSTGGEQDQLIYHGTEGMDAFLVEETGGAFFFSPSVSLGEHVTISPDASVELYRLLGFAGDDTFTFGNVDEGFPPPDDVRVEVDGGGPAGSDTVIYNSEGETTVDLGSAEITDDGVDGSPNVIFSAVELIDVRAHDENLIVQGTEEDDIMQVIPLGANSGRVETDGEFPAVVFEDVEAFTVDPLGADDTVTVMGNSVDNTISIDRSAPSVQVDSRQIVDIDGANTEAIVVDGRAGDDTITVSGSGGPPVTVQGGAPGASDTLVIEGDADAGDAFTYQAGASVDSGMVVLDGDETAFEEVETLTLDGGGGTGTDTLTMNATGASDQITLRADLEPDGTTPVTDGGSVETDFAPELIFTDFGSGPDSALTLNGLGGDDSITARQVADWVIAEVSINGGAPSSSDSVAVIGADDTDETFVYSALTQNSGTLQVESPSGSVTTTYNLQDVEELQADARGQNDDVLEVDDTNALITPGFDPGAGVVEIFSGSGAEMLGLSYEHFESATVTGTSVAVDGTASDDTIRVDSTGTVTVTNLLGFENSLDVSAFDEVILNPMGGNDSVTIEPGAGFDVTVLGGEPSTGSDSVTAISDGSVSVDLTNSMVTGVVTGTISLVDVEELTVQGADGTADAYGVSGYGSATDLESLILDGGDTDNNDGDTVDVSLTAGPDQIEVTPLSDTSARIDTASGPAISVVQFNNADDNLTIDGLGSADAITLMGSTAADDFTAETGGAGTRIAQSVGGTGWVPVDFTGVEGLIVDGGVGMDTLQVDNSSGLVLPNASGITYHGGDADDTLVLTGSTTVETSTYDVGPGPDQGSINHVVGGDTQTVSFTGLEPVIDSTTAATLTVNATDGDNAIEYGEGPNSGTDIDADPDPDETGLVSVDGFETIEFANKTDLVINAGAGSDVINFADGDADLPDGLAAATVNGGGPGGSDRVIVNGIPGATEAPIVRPSSQGAGVVDRSTLGPGVDVQYTGTEELELVGQEADDDGFGVDGTPGNDQFRYFTGDTPDTGRVLGTMAEDLAPFALPAIDFSGMDPDPAGGGGRAFNQFGAQGGDDEFVFSGSSENDFLVISGGLLTHTIDGTLFADIDVGGAPVGTTSRMIVNTGDGDDETNVTPVPIVSMDVVVNGGGPDASDVLNYFGGITPPITLDLETRTISQSAAGDVSFAGQESIVIDAFAENIEIDATTGDDGLTFEVTGPDAGTLTVAGLNTVFDLTSVADLDIDALAGSDTLTVVGSAADDDVDVSDAAVTPAGLQGVNDIAGVEALAVHGREGTDTFHVTPSATVPIFIDGGDPIGQGSGDLLDILSGGGDLMFAQGPQSDEGRFTLDAGEPVSFDRIEQLQEEGSPYQPPAPSTPDLQAFSDTGASSTDELTSAEQPAFAGTGLPGSIVRLRADGEVVGEAVVRSDQSDGDPSDGEGIWEVTVEPLGDDTYEITAEIEILMGNVSAPSGSLSITVDTWSQRPTIDLTNEDDTGMSDTDNLTMGESPGVADFRISAETGSSVIIKHGAVQIDTFDFDTVDADSDGFVLREIDFNPLALPVEGSHPLSVEATDAAGNENQSEQLLVTFDVTAPATPDVPDLVPASDSGIFDDDELTNDLTPTFGLSGFGASFWRLQRDGATVSDHYATGNNFTDLITTGDAVYDYQLLAVDAAGNTAGSGVLPVTIDAAAPAVPAAPDLQPGSDSGFSDTDNITKDITPTFDISNPGGEFFRIYRNGELVSEQPTLGDDGGIYKSGITETLSPQPEGVFEFRLRAVDRAGNESLNSEGLEVFFDITEPVNKLGNRPLPPDLLPSSDTGVPDDNVTAMKDVTFQVQTPNDLRFRLWRDDVPNRTRTMLLEEDGSADIDTAQVPDPQDRGIFQYRTTYVDVAGNESVFSAPLEVQFTDLWPIASHEYPDGQVVSIYDVDADSAEEVSDPTIAWMGCEFSDCADIMIDYNLHGTINSILLADGKGSTEDIGIVVENNEWVGAVIDVRSGNPEPLGLFASEGQVGWGQTRRGPDGVGLAGGQLNQLTTEGGWRLPDDVDGDGDTDDLTGWYTEATSFGLQVDGDIAADVGSGEGQVWKVISHGDITGEIFAGANIGWVHAVNGSVLGDVTAGCRIFDVLAIGGDIHADITAQDGIGAILAIEIDGEGGDVTGGTDTIWSGGRIDQVLAIGGRVTTDIHATGIGQIGATDGPVGIPTGEDDQEVDPLQENGPALEPHSIDAGGGGVGFIFAVGGGLNADVNSTGGVGGVFTTDDLTGNITVGDYLGSVTALGNMTGSDVSASRFLGKVTVLGNMRDSDLKVTDSFLGEVVVLNDITNSHIRLVDGEGDLSGFMGSLYAGGNMHNSSIEARTLGSVYVEGQITEDDADGDTDVIRALEGVFFARDADPADAGLVSKGNPLSFDGLEAFVGEDDENNG